MQRIPRPASCLKPARDYKISPIIKITFLLLDSKMKVLPSDGEEHGTGELGGTHSVALWRAAQCQTALNARHSHV